MNRPKVDNHLWETNSGPSDCKTHALPHDQDRANLPNQPAEPHSSVGSVVDLRTGGCWFHPWLGQYSFRGSNSSHCNRIHSSLIAFRCLDNGYLGKQPVAWKENCAEYWLKELQESMDRCTGRCDITEILLKTALNTIQSINQSSSG